jgi:predicted RNase H-like nuclease (RuvC/YqgF family)
VAANLARPSGRKTVPVKEAKDRVLDLIVKGATVSEAMSAVNRSEETYKSWRSTDEDFRAALIRIRDQQKTTKETGREPVPDFETFSREWLKQPLHSHQQNLYDFLTNATPRN